MRHFLGFELGSTRVKAVLIDERFEAVASGAREWENEWRDGYWTYGLDGAFDCLRGAYGDLSAEHKSKYGAAPRVDAIGISAMMHGYLAFDAEGDLLTPFRTWRNTTTGQASRKLTEEFGFYIPQRWSVAHLYQAALNKEPHVGRLRFLTTLAGYVHWKLTGRKAAGVGDASGIMPLGPSGLEYDTAMAHRFRELTGIAPGDVLPDIKPAGEHAGGLTAEGALLLSPSGELEPGIPCCPPEGDAGTGMVATNSVAERTGNISAGTSVFVMTVLEKPLRRHYEEIDVIATPAGKPVAMVHCNNCTSDIDAWVNLFSESLERFGARPDRTALFDVLYAEALKGDPDCGGLFSCNYVSGEHLTGFAEGRPLFARLPGSRFTLANFMRAHLFSSVATLRIGMEILTEKEKVPLDYLTGHGGLFKASGVGQRLVAAALNVPVAVPRTAGEGGAWGIALLAAFMVLGREGESLESFLGERVFARHPAVPVEPSESDVKGFAAYFERYKAGLAAERAAVAHLK